MKNKNNSHTAAIFNTMHSSIIKKYLLSTLLLMMACIVPALAQKKDKKLETENVDIVRDYKPKILDAAKIEVLPEAEKLEVKKPSMSYTTPFYLFPTATYKSTFRTLQITKTEQEPLQHAWVKAGFGNYSNIYLEGFVNTTYRKDAAFTAQAKYNSGNGPLANGQFMNALIDLSGKKIFGKNIVSGGLNFKDDMYHFYRYNHDTTRNVDPNKIKQNFTDINVNAAFEHAMADTGQLKYKLGVAFYTFHDNFKANENDLTITGRAIEPFHTNSIIFDAGFDYMAYKFIKTINRNIVNINVNYKFDLDGLRGYAGFKTSTETNDSSSTFHFYPNLYIEGDLSEKALVGFLGLTGGLQKNTFKSFATENPFVQSGLDLRNTNNKLKVFVGLKGGIGSNGFYLVSLSYELYKNMYFYVNDTADTKRFLTWYDDNTKVLNIHAEGGMLFNTKFSMNAIINYYSYALNNPLIQKPFHKPGLELGLGANYKIENKIVLGTNIFVMDKRYALLSNGKDITTLKPVFDLNLNGTYKHSETLAFFVELNNLLNQQYQVWNNYPVRGIMVMGGVKINFW